LQGNSPLQEPENLEVLTRTLDKIYARQVSCSTAVTLPVHIWFQLGNADALCITAADTASLHAPLRITVDTACTYKMSTQNHNSTIIPLCPLQALATVALDGSIALQTQPTPQEVARVLKNEPRDNTTPTTWLNLLLSSYAGLQLLNSIVAFNLLQQGYGAYMQRLSVLRCAAGSSSCNIACHVFVRCGAPYMPARIFLRW
jgi:hypothetical protein